MNFHRLRKVIGATMMIVGGAGLGLFVLVTLLLVFLAIAEEEPVEAGLILGALFSLVAMRIWKSTRRVVPPVLLCVAVGYCCYYRWWTAEGVLAAYGVHFNPSAEVYASPGLNKVAFWFDGPHGQVPGPEMMGDMLTVETPYRTSEGQIEFTVRSGVYPGQSARIQLVSPPNGEVAFRVLDTEHPTLRVYYPLQPGLSFD